MSGAFASTGRTVMDEERTNSITPPLKERDGSLKRMFCRTSDFRNHLFQKAGYIKLIKRCASLFHNPCAEYTAKARWRATSFILQVSNQMTDVELKTMWHKLCSAEQI